MRRRWIWEADGDNANGGGNNAATNNANGNAVDTSDVGGDANTADTNAGNDAGQDQNNTDTNNNQDNTDPNEQEPSDDDFNIDTGDDDGTGDDTGDSGGDDLGGGDDTTNTDDNTPSPEEDNQNDESVESDIKTKEKAIYASLSPAEQRVKNRQLKRQFKDLYNNCSNIIEKINDVGSDIDDIGPELKRSITILYQIKENIYDYLMDLYDSKSYFENEVTYKSYLQILNGIKKILDDIDKHYNPDEDTKTKDTE